jgi:Raf kinase inhibitor-like YbhB/YbcL family protein
MKNPEVQRDAGAMSTATSPPHPTDPAATRPRLPSAVLALLLALLLPANAPGAWAAPEHLNLRSSDQAEKPHGRSGGNLSDRGSAAMTLTLTSPDFAPQGAIPSRFTCEAAPPPETSPALAWSGVPAGAKSLALIVDDPDAPDPQAPKTTWVHWVLYDLPPASAGLPEGAGGATPGGPRDGLNDWRRTGYGGPCPPIGRHRYFFKLYALDTPLPDLHRPTKQQLEQAMNGHVVARAELVGTYEKRRK